jgi:hypothetical protein
VLQRGAFVIEAARSQLRCSALLQIAGSVHILSKFETASTCVHSHLQTRRSPALIMTAFSMQMDVQPPTEPRELSFAELAASGDPANLAQAAMAAQPLSTLSKADAAAIESAAMRAHGGTIDKGSFASLAQSVADANEGRFTQRAEVVPPYAGGDAAAARAADFNVVASALRGTAYDLAFVTRARAQELESAAAKAHRGSVEKGSYASRAQVLACSLHHVSLIHVQAKACFL